MIIRKATIQDYDAVWEIFHAVVKTGTTYVFRPETPKEDLEKYWFGSSIQSYVLESDGRILGTYVVKPNQIDLGSHIANGSYMVHPDSRGKGIGGLLCEHSLLEAKKLGFIAMQFNIVVSTNKAAVALWGKYGFEVIGTVPDAFNHAELGYVDGYIMYRKL